jgi:hypothetical protein
MDIQTKEQLKAYVSSTYHRFEEDKSLRAEALYSIELQESLENADFICKQLPIAENQSIEELIAKSLTEAIRRRRILVPDIPKH